MFSKLFESITLKTLGSFVRILNDNPVGALLGMQLATNVVILGLLTYVVTHPVPLSH